MNTKDISYLEQINKFYNKSLKSYQVIKVTDTPDYLIELGAEALQIIIKQSTLTKCIRPPKGSRSAHDLDRNIVEALPKQINNPILLINEYKRNSFALISDYKDKDGNNILIAIKLNVSVQNVTVNEITSLYGRNNLGIYIGKHSTKDIHIIDNKKAKQLASLLGLQLPTTLQAFDYVDKLPQQKENVNIKNQKSVMQSLHKYQGNIKAAPRKSDNNLESQRTQQER